MLLRLNRSVNQAVSVSKEKRNVLIVWFPSLSDADRAAMKCTIEKDVVQGMHVMKHDTLTAWVPCSKVLSKNVPRPLHT